ncbi:hypothetical protein ACFVAJ_17680 [Agromyces sp. NPDC057679]|uniref:hypothetical protein n=1 Tax=Agromyces sp. NPDC057679 TaxID=3346207 RepID=UPI00367065C9
MNLIPRFLKKRNGQLNGSVAKPKTPAEVILAAIAPETVAELVSAAEARSRQLRETFSEVAATLPQVLEYKSLAAGRKKIVAQTIENLVSAADGGEAAVIGGIRSYRISTTFDDVGLEQDTSPLWDFGTFEDRAAIERLRNLRAVAVYEAGALRAQLHPEGAAVPKGAAAIGFAAADRLVAAAAKH